MKFGRKKKTLTSHTNNGIEAALQIAFDRFHPGET